MVGVVVFLVIGLWGVVGRWTWTSFVRPHVPAQRVRLAGFAFAAAWFVLPVGDEILGAFHFRQLCREIPPTRYYGPIAVGPGAFFDEQGNRKWKDGDEFARIVIATPDWNRLWETRTEETRLSTWPMRIFQSRHMHFERSTGRLVIESYFRGSGGGLIGRTFARGIHGTYQCRSEGEFPKDETLIAFRRD
jgi:hypothetical protein